MNEPETMNPPKRRWSPCAVAENTATALIACGVIMLMQPFSLTLYGWSFAVTLAGTVLFIVGSKFPE
jgi:VIT1/CCC1 family predicted Fe2+/Mn2+ transporter